MFDVATDWNRPVHKADFGQTLGVWGIGPGPAVQLPLFGPSNARDSVGQVVGLVTDPANFVPGGAAVTSAGFTDCDANGYVESPGDEFAGCEAKPASKSGGST